MNFRLHPASGLSRLGTAVFLASALALSAGTGARAQDDAGFALTGFKTAVAEGASRDRALAAFYRSRDYAPIWTGAGADHAARRAALLEAIRMAPLHGLPGDKFDTADLTAQMAAAVSERDRGRLDVLLSEIWLDVATDLQTGILTPSEVDDEIVREVPLRDASQYLLGITGDAPLAFVRALPPQTEEYRNLMRAKMRMQADLSAGGYGPVVRAKKLEEGDSGSAVVALRDRLIRMGYLAPRASTRYDKAMVEAVQRFQRDNGMEPDGVVGPATLEAINTSQEERLQSIIVAMERERWINRPLGERRVWVNLPDFRAKLIDKGEVVFETRAVVGRAMEGRRSPEFSDVMEHMIINPTWNVPRSIVVGEYLPQIQQNPNAAGHLNLIDARGRIVPRDAVDFTQFTEANFPFDMKQPPSRSNALGLVKFMFPNANNIYLHDTPSKSLFARSVRAFSHGCIRLADPFDFAYTLLGYQEADPKGVFQSTLATGRETQIDLEHPLQVHLVYRTAFSDARGHIQYRDDIYGRDARIWRALAAEGVVLELGNS
ncbi:Murein L,D-transpeptidase YcbB/YkuD [Pseudooceanicola antarcticus]|uniref:Murein L,D-transpeptidase n=1 Tax=Pseudooceanicola antarcticus TaxID=1247613 RepID=A0A285IYU1_9RHOB|nr:L,D-transpeptidase family protein [Pseudooceanicola antarcticus]PJE25794.1 murein L,D-transpeptidase [Pseudooceanicola antarcticus]SNY52827.1 Murein L,D-transpeptidase YcbB/YkuD [Pseudooceanicola antarcticus]